MCYQVAVSLKLRECLCFGAFGGAQLKHTCLQTQDEVSDNVQLLCSYQVESMQKVVSYLTLILLVFLSNIAVADSVYLNTLSLVDNIASIFFAIAYIVGAAFAFMGLVYYRRFRQNANETPLSKVLWTFMLGVLLWL